jgi:hypothetical protein
MPLITFADKVDSKVSTAPLINKIVADDINQLKNGVNSIETPYTSLVQLIAQTGTNAPVATDVYNNTGQTYTWSRVGGGEYRITSSGTPFVINKTIVYLNNGSATPSATWERINTNIIEVDFGADSNLVNASFKIEIYN